MDDAELAAHLAAEAGRRLVGLRARLADASAHERRDQGDRLAHDFLVAALAEARPDDAVVSEEGYDDGSRRLARRLWIVDPLDGTREYSELPRTDWAVHVALWDRDVDDLVAGAVALPALGTVLSTGRPVPPRPDPPPAPRVVVSRSRPPQFAVAVAQRLGAELVPWGSAGGKAMAVVRGDADVYMHSGGMHEWDSAAPVAVARAAGMHTSRLDGSPLQFNTPSGLTPQLLICHPALVPDVLAALRAVKH